MNYIFIFLAGFLIVALSVPQIITISFKKRLFDAPTEFRKVHTRIVPNLGGIAIFAGVVFSCFLFIPPGESPLASPLLPAGLLLFVTGLKDDIIGLGPLKKFVAQFSASFIVAVVADLRITDLQGLFGINELNYWSSIILTVLFVVGVVNSFNLIDGIDGLAGSLGVVITAFYAYLFHLNGDIGWSYVSMAAAGSLIGFLLHNFTPARIFMGDSGSLFVGFLAAILSIRFMHSGVSSTTLYLGGISLISIPATVLSLLIVPLFDTLRVFTLRIMNNKSPFEADRNHIHHRMLQVGMSHSTATLCLVVITIAVCTLAVLLQDIGNTQLTSLIILLVLAANTLFSLYMIRLPRDINDKMKLEEEMAESPVAARKTVTQRIFDTISEN